MNQVFIVFIVSNLKLFQDLRRGYEAFKLAPAGVGDPPKFNKS